MWLKKSDTFECVATMEGHENEVTFEFCVYWEDKISSMG
jgi:hypothetical protein